MKEITACPICESTENYTYLESRNFRINEQPFDVKQCKVCTLRYTSPLPGPDEIGEYYATENYISHTGTKKGLINTLFHTVRFITLRQKQRLIKSIAKGKKHLDIGAGNGVFLEFMQKKGWEVSGIELDDESRKAIESKLQLTIAKTVQENNEQEEYDVITMWHVLEHVYDLKTDILAIKNKLKADGKLVVAVPNCASYDEERYQAFWSAYDLPIHLYHFRPKNIAELFAQFDMEVVAMKPMKFDAFWISLESEKYKNGNKNSLGVYLRGFYYGLISNLKAKNGAYSSQIYILQKK
jgi:2-polyprenyl-3-methyl-5-hydroxy-6-metoxy-1,4-benzoquinol methylase